MKKEKTYTYNQIAFPLLFASVVALFLASTWNMENQIEDLQNENNSLDYALKFQKEQCQYHVQDLMLKIDSLEKELIFYEPQSVGETIDEILAAIISVESSGRDSAYNAREDAVGCLQIRQTMVNDVNRILKRQGFDLQYDYEDRWCRTKSIEMFNIFCEYYGLTSAEEMARCWNGGPRGIDNPATVGYWNKVQDYLDS